MPQSSAQQITRSQTPDQMLAIASSDINFDETTVGFTPTGGLSYRVELPVTAVSGTNPTLTR